MKEVLFTIILFLVCFNTIVFAQEKPSEKLFEIRGFVKDQNKIALAGLNLYFANENFKKMIVSDENGAFSIKIPIGKYAITVNEENSKNFIAFI